SRTWHRRQGLEPNALESRLGHAHALVQGSDEPFRGHRTKKAQSGNGAVWSPCAQGAPAGSRLVTRALEVSTPAADRRGASPCRRWGHSEEGPPAKLSHHELAIAARPKSQRVIELARSRHPGRHWRNDRGSRMNRLIGIRPMSGTIDPEAFESRVRIIGKDDPIYPSPLRVGSSAAHLLALIGVA